MRLIGLTGRAGCGKDTVGLMLSEPAQGRMPFELLAFATPLKDMVEALLDHLGEDTPFGGWPVEGSKLKPPARQWKESDLPSIGKSPRMLLQTLGTEWGRQMVHPDLWLKCAEYAVAALAADEGVDHFCFTDCRFDNEADWIRGQGGEVWHILRPQAVPVASHVSEHGVTLCQGTDSILDNSGSLEDLANAIAHALAGQFKFALPREAA